ncbi:MAG: hypothetical protein HRT74_05095 [Flavobacteriales bacterium]|nr:hypothetical protein [Flavobacteriales bacterium]
MKYLGYWTSVKFLLLFLCFSSIAVAQTEEKPKIVADTTFYQHSPKKATILSAVLPGAGQIYNKKYWKAPIAWGGLAACVYFINDNTKEYRFYREAYLAELDDDPNTVNTTGFNFLTVEARQEQFRRWRELSYICLAGVYVLQIIDANVDAHLFYFDVDEDIALSWTPFQTSTTGVNPGIGLFLNF